MSASAARWLFLCCAIFLSGTLVFLWSAQHQRVADLSRWRVRCVDAACVLALVALLAAGAAAALQAVQVADSTAIGRAALQRFFFLTRTGQVWFARIALLALTFFLLLVWRARLREARAAISIAICALLALAALAVGGFGGHVAAFEPAWPAMLAQAAHLAAVGVWLGALPALAYLLHANSSQPAAIALLQQFSQRALLLMLTIIASGVPLADLQVETIPALLGTHYGVTLIWKIMFIGAVLAAAAHLRFALLPHFVAASSSAPKLVRWIVIEFVLALAVLWCATELSRTVPARHDAIVWPFDFRFSVDATWPDPKLRARFTSGLVLAGIGVLFAWVGLAQRMALRRWLPPLIALMVAGAVIALPALQTDAYPDTYRKTTIAYQAISVAGGARLFAKHCASCHGAAGHGDGPQANSLPIRPLDLTEEHTALHTAGDLFWWLTHGKPPGIMPGFAQSLSEDERWDLINFLRALSAGYQARIIGERIVPRRPWLAAPDFSYVTASGASGTLKDFRGTRVVLLVIGTPALLRERMNELQAQRAALKQAGAALLVIGADENLESGPLGESVVVEGAEEILATYHLLRRTLGNADMRDTGKAAAHIESLIDRFGYLRARWLPGENARGWRDWRLLREQIVALAKEEPTRPPPDDHVH